MDKKEIQKQVDDLNGTHYTCFCYDAKCKQYPATSECKGCKKLVEVKYECDFKIVDQDRQGKQ